MSDAYFGEIRIFAGNFAPNGWAMCWGQTLPISANTALFSILGTQYGGDGRTNFALPNLAGRVPISQGQGQGLTPRTVGQNAGSPSVTLRATEMPAHNHAPLAVAATGSTTSPGGSVWAQTPPGGKGKPAAPLYTQSTPDTIMNANALNVAGNSQPHNNMQPYVGLNYIICVSGIFPSRG